jgi:hypothetical protein
MLAYLAFCEGEEGIPLWNIAPTINNITRNVTTGWLEPYVLCAVILSYEDGTCLITHEGKLAYAVTACLRNYEYVS